jgi:hypothetical protein
VKADLVLVGDVYTVDAARRWADAVAVSGDRIVAVGTESDVLERVGGRGAGVARARIRPRGPEPPPETEGGGRNHRYQ